MSLRRKLLKLPKGTVVPNHIAIILDGNGRWARSRGLAVTRGHEHGARAIKEVMEAARDLGVHTLTIWGFSTENWKRPPKERAKIFTLIRNYLDSELVNAKREGIKLVHIGRKDRLPLPLRRQLKKVEKETKENTNYILNIAIDYGGVNEILRAVKQIVDSGVPSKKIDERLIFSYLDTAGQPYPNPDLFIRTSGEQRLSGLMPLQMVYTELYFEQDHLPDMTSEHLKKAILDYSRRRRRFGGKDKIKHFKFKPEVAAKLELAWWRLSKIPEGQRFRDYAIKHIKEQYGMSKSLAKEASGHMINALVHGQSGRWPLVSTSLRKFYKLVRDEVKLAFEPSLVASLEVKLLKEIGEKKTMEESYDVEDTARQYYAEVYRISMLQAAKLAHLRVLATIEKNLAEHGQGDHHWDRAEDYLQKFYRELKDRVA